MLAGTEELGRPPGGNGRPYGHASAQSLGQGHDIRCHVRGECMVGHPGAGAPHTGLNLVDHEQGAGGRGEFTGRFEITGRKLLHTRLALDRLNDQCGDIGTESGPQSLDIPGGDELHAAGQRLEGAAIGLLVRQRQGAHGAPVEGVLQGEDPRPARTAMETGDLEGGLVGLGAGVGEERFGDARTGGGEREAIKLLRQAHLGRRGEEVGDMAQHRDLLGDRRHDCGVGVPQAVHGDAGEQVDVLGAIGIPHMGTLAAHENAPRSAEGVHDGIRVALQPFLIDAGLVGGSGVSGRGGHRFLPPFNGGIGASPG